MSDDKSKRDPFESGCDAVDDERGDEEVASSVSSEEDQESFESPDSPWDDEDSQRSPSPISADVQRFEVRLQAYIPQGRHRGSGPCSFLYHRLASPSPL